MASILLQVTNDDIPYLPYLKSILKGHNVHLNSEVPLTLYEVAQRCKAKSCRSIATTNPRILQKLLKKHGEKLPSMDDYAGSIIEHLDLEWLILNPIEHVLTTRAGNFLFTRYFSKLLDPDSWFKTSPFTWEIANASTITTLYNRFLTANLCSIDIETVQENLAITCVCYCGVWFNPDGTFTTHCIVLPMDEEFFVAWMIKFNLLPCPKIFQNGKYDNAYFLRYGAPVHNYLFDTLNQFHCWFSELPKRLDFIASFVLRVFQFWKDESAATNREDYYRYNAKDGWATANAFLAIISEWPEYAKRNYLQEFPLAFPCIVAEATGIKLDKAARDELKKTETAAWTKRLAEIQVMVDTPNFNPNSWQQVQKLWEVFGCGKIKGTGKIARDKVANAHPLNGVICKAIGSHREQTKLIGSYLKDSVEYRGRVMYKLDPTGTDTFRLASAEHHYWLGLQIQNIPRDKKDAGSIKDLFITDDGFLWGEGDYEQAESRDTAYLSGDKALIEAVNSPKDFHAANAERFFGVPYANIIGPDGETIDKELRDLAKRPNHGANYNMTAPVLMDTMGIKNVIRAKELLKLPPLWSLIRVCDHLMQVFDKTFPVVRGDYYRFLIKCVKETRMLVGPTGLTRFCFGNPDKSKPDLNAYAAHPSQSLNAATLNKAWLNVFYNVWLPNHRNFKLIAQIHDSILFQYRIGHEYLIPAVKKCMLMTIMVTDTYGIQRPLTVPVAMKAGATRWSKIKTWKGE